MRFMDELMGVQAVKLSTGSYFKRERLFPHGVRLSLCRKTQRTYADVSSYLPQVLNLVGSITI